MPELPEVEIFKQVADSCRGGIINHVSIADPAILDGISAKDLEQRLKGQRVRSTRRRGKHLFLELSGGGTLAMHFGMNGSLKRVSEGEPDPSYARLQIYFEKGDRLAYINPRRLGRVGLAENAEAFIAKTELGPDVLDATFDSHSFAAILAGSKRDIKSVLMDQALMAGIGNIYSDEILFQARVFPGTVANQLKGKKATCLYRAMRKTLETAINSGAGSERGVERLPKEFLLTQRRPGGRCPHCGAPLETVKHAGRTSYYCPRCQAN
ncbi:MAG TPA: DNA-formamidopyrimidine glycosylase [Methylocella sp.]|nr:DNA-formamidopyrimidine glycosylase [Methylocella sp.]